MEERDKKIESYWKALAGACTIQDLKTAGRCYFALKALYKKKEPPTIDFDEPEPVLDPLDIKSIL